MCRILNNEGVLPFGKHRRKIDRNKPHRWQKSSLGRILRNRAVLGEYQPHVGSKKRKPIGDAIEGFYPQIISESEFARVFAVLKSRRHATTTERSMNRNLFAGLIQSQDGVSWTYRNKGAKEHHTLQREDDTGTPIHYKAIEDAIFDSLTEIKPSDLTDTNPKDLDDLEGALLAIDDKIAAFEEKI
jgi:Recombinase